MPAIPASHHHGLAQRGPDHLRQQAESLIAALSEEGRVGTLTTTDLLEMVVDGYAHVLALDVDRRQLKRDIARLAGSGDPLAAEELRELSALLLEVTSTSERLRELLGDVRARDIRGGHH